MKQLTVISYFFLEKNLIILDFTIKKIESERETIGPFQGQPFLLKKFN